MDIVVKQVQDKATVSPQRIEERRLQNSGEALILI